MSTALASRGGGGGGGNYLQRAPNPSGLAEVIDLILDKGLVIDVYVRVSLVGIELLVIDARIVVASVDTYLRFAEAVNRLDIAADQGLTLFTYAAEPGSRSEEALNLLGSWAATVDLTDSPRTSAGS